MKKMAFWPEALCACVLALSVFSFISCGKKAPSVTTKLLTDGSRINDHSYNEKAWNGILQFYHDEWGDEKYFGVLYDIVPCRDPSLKYSTIKGVAESKPDLIILTSFTFDGPLKIIAPGFPNQKFLLVDSVCEGYPNVLSITFAAEEGSFLVGMAAALQAKEEGVTNAQFGFIGGIESDMISDFEAGYVQGIRAVFPDAEIFDYYVGDWEKPQEAAKKTKEWYDGKVYAVYSAAGMTGSGTIAQAVAHRKNGKNVWAIGVDSDQINEGNYGVGKSAVLTSMLKNVDEAVFYGLSLVEKGAFTGGFMNLGLREKGVGYATSNPELKGEVQKKLEAYRAQIIMGEVTVISSRSGKEKLKAVLDTVIHQ